LQTFDSQSQRCLDKSSSSLAVEEMCTLEYLLPLEWKLIVELILAKNLKFLSNKQPSK